MFQQLFNTLCWRRPRRPPPPLLPEWTHILAAGPTPRAAPATKRGRSPKTPTSACAPPLVDPNPRPVRRAKTQSLVSSLEDLKRLAESREYTARSNPNRIDAAYESSLYHGYLLVPLPSKDGTPCPQGARYLSSKCDEVVHLGTTALHGLATTGPPVDPNKTYGVHDFRKLVVDGKEYTLAHDSTRLRQKALNLPLACPGCGLMDTMYEVAVRDIPFDLLGCEEVIRRSTILNPIDWGPVAKAATALFRSAAPAPFRLFYCDSTRCLTRPSFGPRMRTHAQREIDVMVGFVRIAPPAWINELVFHRRLRLQIVKRAAISTCSSLGVALAQQKAEWYAQWTKHTQEEAAAQGLLNMLASSGHSSSPDPPDHVAPAARIAKAHQGVNKLLCSLATFEGLRASYPVAWPLEDVLIAFAQGSPTLATKTRMLNEVESAVGGYNVHDVIKAVLQYAYQLQLMLELAKGGDTAQRLVPRDIELGEWYKWAARQRSDPSWNGPGTASRFTCVATDLLQRCEQCARLVLQRPPTAPGAGNQTPESLGVQCALQLLRTKACAVATLLEQPDYLPMWGDHKGCSYYHCPLLLDPMRAVLPSTQQSLLELQRLQCTRNEHDLARHYATLTQGRLHHYLSEPQQAFPDDTPSATLLGYSPRTVHLLLQCVLATAKAPPLVTTPLYTTTLAGGAVAAVLRLRQVCPTWTTLFRTEPKKVLAKFEALFGDVDLWLHSAAGQPTEALEKTLVGFDKLSDESVTIFNKGGTVDVDDGYTKTVQLIPRPYKHSENDDVPNPQNSVNYIWPITEGFHVPPTTATEEAAHQIQLPGQDRPWTYFARLVRSNTVYCRFPPAAFDLLHLRVGVECVPSSTHPLRPAVFMSPATLLALSQPAVCYVECPYLESPGREVGLRSLLLAQNAATTFAAQYHLDGHCKLLRTIPFPGIPAFTFDGEDKYKTDGPYVRELFTLERLLKYLDRGHTVFSGTTLDDVPATHPLKGVFPATAKLFPRFPLPPPDTRKDFLQACRAIRSGTKAMSYERRPGSATWLLEQRGFKEDDDFGEDDNGLAKIPTFLRCSSDKAFLVRFKAFTAEESMFKTNVRGVYEIEVQYKHGEPEPEPDPEPVFLCLDQARGVACQGDPSTAVAVEMGAAASAAAAAGPESS